MYLNREFIVGQFLTGGDRPGVADVATVPPGEGPVIDDLGGHNDLDAHIEEGTGCEFYIV